MRSSPRLFRRVEVLALKRATRNAAQALDDQRLAALAVSDLALRLGLQDGASDA